MITEKTAIEKIRESEAYFIGLCESAEMEVRWMIFPGGRPDVCVVEVRTAAVMRERRDDFSALFALVEDGAEVHCRKLLSGTPKGGSFGVHDVRVENTRGHCGDGEYLVLRTKELTEGEIFSQTGSFSGDGEQWLMPLTNITGESVESATGQ